MIWNHVNEEKFMFQIGAIIPIVLINWLILSLCHSLFPVVMLIQQPAIPQILYDG